MISSAALRYARALADIVFAEGDPAKVRRELALFAKLYGEHLEFREVFANPGISLGTQREILEEVAGKCGFCRTTRNFLLVLLDHNRLGEIEMFLAAFDTVIDERKGMTAVTVHSATPLAAKAKERLESIIPAVAGKKGKVEYHVDKSLIGGVKIQIGSRIYDGTVRTQLDELRRELGGG